MRDAMTSREFALLRTALAGDAALVKAVLAAKRSGADDAACLQVAEATRDWQALKEAADLLAEKIDRAVLLNEAELAPDERPN